MNILKNQKSQVCKLAAILPRSRKWPPLAAFFVTRLCVIRRYHVYKEVWKPSIGEAFVCFAEEGNSHDRKAVAHRQTTSPNLPKNVGRVHSNFAKGSNLRKTQTKKSILPPKFQKLRIEKSQKFTNF